MACRKVMRKKKKEKKNEGGEKVVWECNVRETEASAPFTVSVSRFLSSLVIEILELMIFFFF